MAVFTIPKTILEFGAGLLARGTDVLANDEAIVNQLNSGILDEQNLDLSMSPTWTGDHTFEADVILGSAGKLVIEDVSNTYIDSDGANLMRFVINGVIEAFFTTSQFELQTALVMGLGDRIWLDNTEQEGIGITGGGQIGLVSAGRFVGVIGANGNDSFYEITATSDPGSNASLNFTADTLGERFDINLNVGTDDLAVRNNAGTKVASFKQNSEIEMQDVDVTGTNSMTARSVAKAWARVTAGGGLTSDLNFSTVVKLGTGLYQLNFSNSMLNVNDITISATAIDAVTPTTIFVTAITANSITVETVQTSNASARDADFSLVVFGRQ